VTDPYRQDPYAQQSYGQQPPYPQQPYGQPQPYPQQQPYALPAGGPYGGHGYGPRPDEVSDASLAHYLGLLGFIGPMIIMITKGERSPWVRANAAEALNFQLTMLIAYFGAAVIGVCGAFFTFGLSMIVMFVPAILGLVYAIIAGGAAKQGRAYRYPMTIRMVS